MPRRNRKSRSYDQPRYGLTPRSVIRAGSGHGTVAWNCIRRITVISRKVQRGKLAKGRWWLTKLKGFSDQVMQMTMSMRGDYWWCTGSVQSCLIGPSDLISSSPLSYSLGGGRILQFAQGRIMHLRITFIPNTITSKRGGSFACAIVPLTVGEALRYSSQLYDKDHFTYDDVINFPNAVVACPDKPISLVYVPRPSDRCYDWLDLGSGPATTLKDYGLRLVYAYRNMTALRQDQQNAYDMDHFCCELVLDGRVEVRSPCSRKVIRFDPVVTRNSSVVTVINDDGSAETIEPEEFDGVEAVDASTQT